MSGFTQVFGSTTIAPANASFLSLNMAADVDLAWPIEQAVSGNVVADTIEVVATAPGLNIDLPDARQVSTGYTTVFNNTGAQTVTVRSATGSVIISLVSGTAWVIYLADNSTEAGTWRVFQLGASVSVAVAGALAGAGLRAISTTLNQDIPITTFAGTPTTLLNEDRAKFFNWTGGVGVLNLPAAAAVGNGWFVQVRNTGSGDLTVTPPSGTIDEAAIKTFAAGTSAFVVTDGNNYFTLGFGSGVGGGSSFDFTEINVAGSGNFTLSGASLNRIAYRFIGALTGNRTIIVPAAIQQYWVANATSGAFSLFIKTAAQAAPGLEIPQNNQSITYCDGNNVIDAESASGSFPVPIAQGGTGAVTAAAARTNLNVRDASVTPDLTAANTFQAYNAFTRAAVGGTVADVSLAIDSAVPIMAINESGAAVDNRLWEISAQGEVFFIRAYNDAGTLLGTVIQVERTGVVIDSITINAPVITPNTSAREVGFKGAPQNIQSGNYTAVLSDAGLDLTHPNGAGAGDTFTIPSNAAVPYPIGTYLFFTNLDPNALTININIDSLILSGSGAAGARSLVQYGSACARKVTATLWLITGTGLS